MKYKTNQTIYIGDIVKPTKGLLKDKLCIVTDKLKLAKCITCRCIETGFDISDYVIKFNFVQHCSKDEQKEYLKLAKKLGEKFRNKYRSIDYIKNNWNTDIFILNGITSGTLNSYYGVLCFNPNMMCRYKEEIGNVFLTGSSMKDMLYDMDLIFEL